MSAGIQIGGFDAVGVAEYTEQVLRIVVSHEDTDVVEKALDTLARLVEATPSPQNTTIHGCTITMNVKAAPKKRPAKKRA